MRAVVIVGGGLAGLTLGVLLRARGVPTQVWEANSYPRHRVCGEFISGAGAELLCDLLPELKAWAWRAKSVRFFANGRSTARMGLPVAGLSIARWELDWKLAELFVRSGGELKLKQRWTESFACEGVVQATGRRIHSQGPGWTGLKAHLRGLELSADLEMHFSDEGYVGISRLPDGVNVCALVRDEMRITNFRSDPKSVFKRLMDDQAAARLEGADLDPESLCAVSGISLKAGGWSGSAGKSGTRWNASLPGGSAGASSHVQECCVGDAIRMIPPFTGNGMSLAVESAFTAAEPLTEFSAGDLEWTEAARRVNRRCAERFRKRFAAASLLARMADRNWTRALMLSSLRTVPGLLPICFGMTR